MKKPKTYIVNNEPIQWLVRLFKALPVKMRPYELVFYNGIMIAEGFSLFVHIKTDFKFKNAIWMFDYWAKLAKYFGSSYIEFWEDYLYLKDSLGKTSDKPNKFLLASSNNTEAIALKDALHDFDPPFGLHLWDVSYSWMNCNQDIVYAIAEVNRSTYYFMDEDMYDSIYVVNDYVYAGCQTNVCRYHLRDIFPIDMKLPLYESSHIFHRFRRHRIYGVAEDTYESENGEMFYYVALNYTFARVIICTDKAGKKLRCPQFIRKANRYFRMPKDFFIEVNKDMVDAVSNLCNEEPPIVFTIHGKDFSMRLYNKESSRLYRCQVKTYCSIPKLSFLVDQYLLMNELRNGCLMGFNMNPIKEYGTDLLYFKCGRRESLLLAIRTEMEVQ